MTQAPKEHDQGQKIQVFIFAVLFLAYGVYLFFAFAQIPMDSDFASLVLEAQDILDGNLFLEDWNLTGVTFLFSEIPFYLLGTAIFGVSTKAYLAASVAMLFLLFLFGYLLLENRKKPLTLLLYFGFAAFPSAFLLYSSRAHVAIYVLSFAAILCLKKLADRQPSFSKPGLLYTLYFLILALGTASDAFILPVLAIPVILYCLRMLVSNEIRSLRRAWWILGLTLAGIAAGKLIETGYIAIGHAALNSRSASIAFTPFNEIPETILFFFELLLKLSNGYPDGLQVFSLDAIAAGLHILVMVWGIVVVIRSIKKFITGDLEDPVSILLSLGILCLSVFLIVVPFLGGKSTGRYFAYFPVAFAVLIIRQLQGEQILSSRFYQEKIPFAIPAAVLACLLIIFSVRPVSLSRIPTPQDRLATYLKENNLTEGYAEFWDANHVVVASENTVHVRAIHFDQVDGVEAARPYYWFSKNQWVPNPEANFIVAINDNSRSVNEANILKYFGEPLEKINFDPYNIYVYPKGISETLVTSSPEK